jgi:surfeit locus 1 family protein
MLTLVGIALFVGFISLGVWQVQRRAWKLDLIERVTQRLQSAPVPLPASTEWPGMDATRAEYLPVHLQGVWLADKTALTQATTALGAGFWVMTPLQLAEGGQVLVNRGFVPQEQRAQWQKPASAPDEPVTIEGVVRMSEPGGGFLRRNDPAQQRWHSRDVAALAQSMQLPQAAPFFVDAGLPDRTSAAQAEVTGARQGPWPRTGLTVVRFSNSHAVYALTWFGLALMVVGAAVVVARYELRLRAAHPPLPAHDQQR